MKKVFILIAVMLIFASCSKPKTKTLEVTFTEKAAIGIIINDKVSKPFTDNVYETLYESIEVESPAEVKLVIKTIVSRGKFTVRVDGEYILLSGQTDYEVDIPKTKTIYTIKL